MCLCRSPCQQRNEVGFVMIRQRLRLEVVEVESSGAKKECVETGKKSAYVSGGALTFDVYAGSGAHPLGLRG